MTNTLTDSNLRTPTLARRRSASASLAVASLGALVALTGCANQGPLGETQNRVGVTSTSAADLRDPAANPANLFEFSDRVAEAVADRLLQEPRVQALRERGVLVMGTMENRTSTPGNDFELIRRRVINSITNNRQLRTRLMVTRSLSEAQAIAAKEGIAPPVDRLDEGRGRAPAGPAQYAPDQLFNLTGEFFAMERSGSSTYYWRMVVTHVGSREEIFSQDFEYKQLR
jgi:hypothetical protein